MDVKITPMMWLQTAGKIYNTLTFQSSGMFIHACERSKSHIITVLFCNFSLNTFCCKSVCTVPVKDKVIMLYPGTWPRVWI
jgi:hypothetical protein